MEVSRWVVGFAVSGLTLVKLSLNGGSRLNLRLVDALLASNANLLCLCQNQPGSLGRSRGV